MTTKTIGTLGNVPTITVGGVTFTDLTNLVILEALTGATTTDENDGFRKTTSSGGAGNTFYQVPSGKTFVLYAIRMDVFGASGTYRTLSVRSSTTSVGLNGTPTSPIGIISGASSSDDDSFYAPVATDYARAIYGSCAQNTYPYVRGISTAVARVYLYGYEV